MIFYIYGRLLELFGSREEPRELRKEVRCQRHGFRCHIRYFLLSHHLSTFPLTTLLILTNTFSFTPALFYPTINMLYLHHLPFSIFPSTPQSLMPSIIPNNLSLSPANSPQYNKWCTISSTHLHHIAHIYHPYTYHTSPCHPRALQIPSST